MRLKHLTVAVTLALSGCSLIPDYQRPDMPIQAQWPEGAAYDQGVSASTNATELGWRQFFVDPTLQRLISLSLENNRDLRQAALNVEAYRAQYRISRSDLFPSIGVEGSGQRQRLPADLSNTGEAGIASQYGVTLGVSAYELDLFGRLRSLEEGALARYLATEEAQRSVQIGLVSDVAMAYLTWRTDQGLLELTRGTLYSYGKSLSLVQAAHDVGTASALDVRQARSLVEQARVQFARYSRLVAQDANLLRLLLGTELPADLSEGFGFNSVFAELPVGMPADLLLRRPDIRAAEYRLQAANANIGAARAAFFPSIRLTAAAGTLSSELDGLFEGGSGTWSFMPQINIPIFTAGRLKANLDYAEVQKDINIAQYEQSIQTAFREVADGLAARGTFEEQLQAQADLTKTTQEYLELAQQRYQEGVDNYLAVLDAQRELFSAQQQLLSDRLLQLQSEVQLFKALGGGWSENVALGNETSQ
ncbi:MULTISPECIES: AdeC/AdeK/OprM family multidrug efflux complex outer membrane factor [Pseudomonadaceae]|uniref:RND efflux system outer membrane lipoprotein n=1 Tax=Pseudomonas saudiphocaensis TaxID=1499686 RepID=A0A078LUD8_9PSED|nr:MULTISPECIES: AdeC/AdeK/OprM family multidrug efflux complex outer membrane factor [Pseudomonadaceae]MCF6783671.1 AdeC/AdeK/OprM family multidrug efflux complex outer membrane factor [Stutzerimonas stutzeri]MCF6806521.1 AdeC/AdeK/OprM family multidrug efflux complex outer membrane factor [Stutzerimonas stutzeri]CDZ93902.1 RND efflux system outer membrane lipoprotein [Pseudomonas saudiphocaensis]